MFVQIITLSRLNLLHYLLDTMASLDRQRTGFSFAFQIAPFSKRAANKCKISQSHVDEI